MIEKISINVKGRGCNESLKKKKVKNIYEVVIIYEIYLGKLHVTNIEKQNRRDVVAQPHLGIRTQK